MQAHVSDHEICEEESWEDKADLEKISRECGWNHMSLTEGKMPKTGSAEEVLLRPYAPQGVARNKLTVCKARTESSIVRSS